MTIYDYARSGAEMKNLIIREEAVLIENYKDGENTICVYLLDDFFVEITMNKGTIIDNIPFKRGYRYDKKNIHTLEKKTALYKVAA